MWNSEVFHWQEIRTEKVVRSGISWFGDGPGKSSFRPWYLQQPTYNEIKSVQMTGEEYEAANLVCSYKIPRGESKKKARSW